MLNTEIIPVDELLNQQQLAQMSEVSGSFILRRVGIAPLTALLAGPEAETITGISLAPEELAIFKEFRLGKRRAEWLAGRWAAKNAALTLLTSTDCDPRQLTVLADKHGRPMLKAPGRSACHLPQISISHSGAHAVALAAWQTCGIDVQKISPQLARVADHFCSMPERELLASTVIAESDGHDLAGLALLWTAKEALRKIFGVLPMPGFRDFSLIRVTGHPEQIFKLYFQLAKTNNNPLPTVTACLFEGYAIACAIKNQVN